MILSSWLFAKYIFPKLNTSKNVGIEFNCLHYRFWVGMPPLYALLLAMVYLIHGSILNTILFYLFNEVYQGNLLEGKSDFFTITKESSPSPIIRLHSLHVVSALAVYCYFFTYSRIYGAVNLLVYIGIQLGSRYQDTLDSHWKALVILIIKYSIFIENKLYEYKNTFMTLMGGSCSPLPPSDQVDTDQKQD
jgi:hypothetical protein